MSIITLTSAAQHLFLRFKSALWAVVFAGLFAQGTQAQTIGEYRSRQDGSWNNTTTWEQYAGAALGWVTQYQTGATPVVPTVQGNNSGSENSNVTSHAINLPAGTAVGELLVVVFSVDGDPAVNINTGVSGNNWTKLGQASNSDAITGAIFYKIAEASNALTLTTTDSERSSHRSYRVSGGTAFQVFGVAANGGNANTANPPSLTPAPGSASYLWIATASKDGNAQVATAAPANFTGLLTTSVANNQGASTSTAIRSLTATNQDPGNFTGFGSNEEWVSYTLAVYSTNPVYSPISFPQTGFPVVGGTNTSSQNTATTTHDVALPSGIYPGDLLLIFWTDEDNTSSITTTGWTELYNNVVGNRRRSAYYRIATGSEEGFATFTTSATETSAHNAYRIEAGSYHGVPTAETNPATGTNTSPNPPSHTPGGGAKSFLWIAASHSAGNATGTAPTSYGNLIAGYTGTTGDNHARTMTARRELAAASEDPATFALGTNRNWAANTVAIRGSGTATVRNGHTVGSTANVSVPDVTVESGGTVLASNSTTFTTPASGTFAVNGTLQMGTNGTALMAGAGAFSLNSGGTLGITNGAGITTSGATGNVQNTSRTFNNAANYVYNGGSAQNTGNGLTQGVNITIDNAAGVALNNNVVATGAIILKNGTLTPTAANRIGNSTRIVFDGGVLGTNGFGDTVGAMDLISTGTIALGSGNHTFIFANSSSEGWAGSGLTITGWTGTPGLTGTNGKIFVGAGGLTSAQRAKISFNGYPGTPVILPSGELVPSTPASLAITAGTADHGSSCVDIAATTVQYTITNSGGIALDVEVSSDNSEFAVGNAPDQVLGSGGTATFDVTFTPSGTGARSATITIVWEGHVTPLTLPVTGAGFVVTESASIGYTGSPHCSNSGTASVSRTGFSGGTYSSTAGLSINAATGAINLGASTPGAYTVTYTFGACQQETTASVTINGATLWYEDSDEDGAGDPLVSMLACEQPAGYVANNTDQCPGNPGKSEPGICGCAAGDEDTDGDGTVDCVDGCPDDPFKTELGFCGCGTADTDNNADGIPDCLAGEVVSLYLRSSQSNTGTGAYVRDLLPPMGSPSANVTTNNTSSTTFSERLSFTIDHGALASPVGSGGAFLASVNVNAVSNANLQYRFRVVRQNAAGVVQEATPYSASWNTTGVRSIPVLMPATTWAANDRLVLSVEVRATTGSNRNITIATNNANSWLGYVPSKPVHAFRSAQSGPWSDIVSWQQQYDNGDWGLAAAVPAALAPSTVTIFPEVAATTTSLKTTTTNTTHTMALPAGIQAGDLIMVFFSEGDASTTVPTLPAGYTLLYSSTQANYYRAAWYRIADGTEGTSVSTTNSFAGRSAHVSYRIAAGTYQGVPVAGSVVANASLGNSADPPSLTSGFGAVPTMWIASCHTLATGTLNPPAAYAGNFFSSGNTGSPAVDQARMSASHRFTSAASENPAAFTTGNTFFATNTIAIRGASVDIHAKSSTTIRNGHGITVNDARTADNMVVENGGTLDLAAGSLTLRGSSLVADGTINGAAGALILDGGASDMAVTVSGSGSLNVFDLTAATSGGVALNVNTGIRGTLQLNAGVFAANGAVRLVSNASGTGRLGPVAPGASYSGVLTVNRFIPAGATNWRILGSSVGGQTVNQLRDDFTTAGFPGSHAPNFDSPVGSGILWPSIRWYDETNTGASINDGLVGVSGVGQPLATGQGFAAWCGTTWATTTAFTVDMTGAPNVAQSAITLPMTFTNTGNPSVDGWNMVSNPLPSPIAFDQIVRGANVEDHITYFDPATGNNATYDISSGVGTNGGTNVIQSSQGFWLKANGAAVTTTVHENAKVAGNTGGFFGGSQIQTAAMVRLRITSGINQFSDETVVLFNNGEPGLDGDDVPKFIFAHPDAPQIATQSDGGELIAINAYGPYSIDISIPVAVNVAINGNYTITVTGLALSGLTCLRLEDLATGSVTPVVEGAAYTFAALSTDVMSEARFVLHASAPVPLVATDATCHGRDDGAANVDLATAADVVWSDLGGVVLLEQNNVSGPTGIAALEAGQYRVSITSSVGCGALNTIFTIAEPGALEVDAIAEPTSCPASADGTIALSVLGGVAPYTYAWSNDAANADITVAAGTYTVVVSDANGCSMVPQEYVVSAGEGPEAQIVLESGTVLVNAEVLFAGASSEGVSHTWDFGDGTTSTELEPVHTYAEPGAYTVTLTVDDGNCTSVTSLVLFVEVSTGLPTIVGSTLNAYVSGDHIVVDHNFSNDQPVVIRVFSTSGQLAQEHRVAAAPARITLPTAELATGIWLVRVSNGNSAMTFSLPIVH